VYSPALTTLLDQALVRLDNELGLAMPGSTAQIIAWTEQLAGASSRRHYFQHPIAFPSLLLPWWVFHQILTPKQAADLDMQAKLVYSTVNGYYFIRLIDNLMDAHTTVEQQILPALGFFHTQFQSAYQLLFPADHPFWPLFRQIWFRSAEAVMRDAQLEIIDLETFRQTSAQKVCAAKIPVAAVCYYYDRIDLLAPWTRFVDLFGSWHQMFNDMFDWYKDSSNQNVTYFLSEADRRRRPGEAVAAWVAREGFSWGLAMLQTWMEELHRSAEALDCPALADYLHTRQTGLEQQACAIQPGLQTVARLLGN
jgi:DNA-binding transcriptional regulator YbjK